MSKWFDREKKVLKDAREAISALKPIRFSTDSLKAEIAKGDARADDIVALILYVEDLTVALNEAIGQAEEIVAVKQKQAIPPVAINPNARR